MWKQNQSHQHLYRPFPNQHPECKFHHSLTLNSNCSCPPCQAQPNQIEKEIHFDTELEILRNKKTQSLSQSPSKNNVSDIITFLNEIQRHCHTAVPNIPILDTVVFNPDGNVRYIVGYEHTKLKISRLTTQLKSYLIERKHNTDLEFQKRKFQREHMGFSFTQLDNTSQKLIKQFENNIKYINPLLNRVLIAKWKNKDEEEILTQTEVNSIFTKISRRLFDLSNVEYLQIFPVMYSHEESSYIRRIKYFREKEFKKKNYKIAEHYLGNWFSKNQTLENMELAFLNTLRDNEEEYLMYFTYKLFAFFQKVSNKMIQSALLTFITNDEGNSFSLKNIESLSVLNLVQVVEKTAQLPKKLENFNPETDPKLDLKQEMQKNFKDFQTNYERLEREGKQLEEKRQNDINFSNKVYESLGKEIPVHNKESSFIKSIYQEHNREDRGKIIIETPIESYRNFD